MKTRRFKRFIAIDRHGNPAWGSLKASEKDCREYYSKHNPDPTGQTIKPSIHAVSIIINKENLEN